MSLLWNIVGGKWRYNPKIPLRHNLKIPLLRNPIYYNLSTPSSFSVEKFGSWNHKSFVSISCRIRPGIYIPKPQKTTEFFIVFVYCWVFQISLNACWTVKRYLRFYWLFRTLLSSKDLCSGFRLRFLPLSTLCLLSIQQKSAIIFVFHLPW